MCLIAGFTALLLRAIIFYELFVVVRNFGQGLQERGMHLYFVERDSRSSKAMKYCRFLNFHDPLSLRFGYV